jgi:hypothetical protein
MRRLGLVCSISLTFIFMVALAVPAYAQQEDGDKEIQVSGLLAFVPHKGIPQDNLTGIAVLGVGYYPRKTHRIGFQLTSGTSGGQIQAGLGMTYRYLIGTGNPKVYPYLGAGGLQQGLRDTDGVWQGAFVVTAETGLKVFLSQKFSLDTGFTLGYVPQGSGTFVEKSGSMMTMGFAYIF